MVDPTVLIVEDDGSIARLLSRTLSTLPGVVRAANTVAEARAILGHVEVDLVVADYYLEGESETGLEFLEEVRQVQPRAARILLTGDIQISDNECAQAVVYKPWRSTALIGTCRELLLMDRPLPSSQTK